MAGGPLPGLKDKKRSPRLSPSPPTPGSRGAGHAVLIPLSSAQPWGAPSQLRGVPGALLGLPRLARSRPTGLGRLSGSQPQPDPPELRWAVWSLQAGRPDPPSLALSFVSRFRLARPLRSGEREWLCLGEPGARLGCLVVVTYTQVVLLKIICIIKGELMEVCLGLLGLSSAL